MESRHAPPSQVATLTALLLAGCALAGCAGHGKYTTELLEQSAKDRARLRAATQYDMAMQQFQSGDLERALGTVDGSLSLNDETAQSYLLRGRILLELGRSGEALGTLDAGIALNPTEAKFYYYRAIAFERAGRDEDALAAFQRAAAADPTEAQYVLASVDELVELGRLEEARELLTNRATSFESTPGFRQALGHVAMLEGDHEAAIRAFTEAAVLGPNDPVFREDLCHAQIAARDFLQAEATLARLETEEGYEDRRDLQHLRASCLMELERPVEARNILFRLTRSRDAVTIDVDAWVKLIDISLMLRDDALLNQAARRLMAVAPSRHEGYLAMAMWQRRAGDLDGALRSLDRAIARAADDPTPGQLKLVIEHQRAAAAATAG